MVSSSLSPSSPSPSMSIMILSPDCMGSPYVCLEGETEAGLPLVEVGATLIPLPLPGPQSLKKLTG